MRKLFRVPQTAYRRPKQKGIFTRYTMLPLTSQERKVILFVLCLLVFGLGIDCFKKRTQRHSLIDYETLKSRFFDKVDINKANFSQLSSVPGMGENLANAIIT